MAETDPQRDIEQRRERDDGGAGQDRNLEFEAEMYHQNRRKLAENGEPAQPDQRIQPHVARALMSSRQTKHAANVTTAADQ